MGMLSIRGNAMTGVDRFSRRLDGGLILRLASFCFLFFLTTSSSDGAVRYSETHSDLQMVTIDNRHGNVFAAGANVVYRFGQFLGPVVNASKTGPERRHCTQLTGACSNEARILEIIPNSESLLFCGSGRYGLCTVIDMDSMSTTELNASNRLSYAGGKESVCGFFSQSLANGALKQRVLYMANDGRPSNVSTSWAGSVSALLFERRRDPLFSLRYHFEDRATKSALEIGLNLRPSYDVRYIYGFEHNGFTYFVTVQRESLASDSLYETKLARVCQQDSGFFSYTEITLACRKSGISSQFYNIALAAHMSTPGRELRQKLRLSLEEKVLYIVFGQSLPNHSSAVRANGSVLCLYSMTDVRKAFTAAQVACYRGSGRLLPWINPAEPPCKTTMDMILAINDSFCGNAVNVGIRDRYPLQTDANFTTRKFLATSLRTVAVYNKTVALIGTTSGHLLKVVIDGTDADPYDVIDVGAGSAIRNDMELDENEENVYVLSGKKISMVPLKSCSIYSDCSSCIMKKDPMNCGWCEDHCSTKSTCLTGWFNGHCPPVIHSFWPRTGPVEGGTIVTIDGQNFGNGTLAGSLANVKVANNFECHIDYRNSTCIICKTKSSPEPLEREFQVSVKDASKTTVGFEIHGSSNSGPYSFSYKVAAIKRITPAFGPASGGTNLTIAGTNLDIGSDLTVSVVGKRCIVTNVSSSEVLCRTSPLDSTETGQLQLSGTKKGFVEVTIDNAALTQDHYKYSYCEDPVIFNIFPNRSILSGGMNLTVIGKNLDCVGRPRLYVNLLHEETKYDDACHAEAGGAKMICESPDLKNASSIQLSVNQPLLVEMRFAMDGVRELWNFPDSQPSLSRLGYTVDPEFFPHPENESMQPLLSSHLMLKLQGRNLNLSAALTDYIVLVGGQMCNLTLLTMNELACWQEQPISIHQKDLVVRVGSLVFYPGQIRLPEESRVYDHFFSLWMPVILAFIFGSTIVFVIVCIICLKSRHRGPFRRKFQTVPNVLYSGGSQVDLGANRVTQTAMWLNPVSNSYLSHSEAIQQRLTHVNGHSSREPILDEESRRLLNDSHLLINHDRLVLLDIIGQGHFGCVYRGFLKVEPKAEAEVAVKTLKSRTECIYMSPTESKKFLDEALTMREFDHVHVLKLIGIVIDKEEFPLVVLPFMKHGDLLSYIRCADNSPTVKNLMEFAMQIADGMNYLANLKFVHRDLAARNCMLDDDMLVKVADFGLSRDIYESDYYSSDDRKAKLPVKWMALESLEKGIYSTKTDVWSFGVVLWELMTRGICPYPEVDNWDIIKYIKSGRRMLQPSYCPDSLYKIMLHCWNPDHTQRPTFDELVEWIRNIIAKMEGAQHAVSLDVEYINTDVQSQGYLCPLDSQYPEGNVIQNVPEMSDDVHHPAGLNMKYINSNVHGHGYICPVDSRFPEGAAAAANCESYVPDYLSVASSYSTLV